MSLPAFASPSDLELSLPADVPTPDEERAEALLARVSTAIRAEVGKSFVDETTEDLIDDTEALDLLRDVCVGAAKRVVLNPTGASMEVKGPFTRQFGSRAGDEIRFTDTEQKMLARAAAIGYPETAGVPGLATLSMTRGPLETRQVLPYSCDWDEDDPW